MPLRNTKNGKKVRTFKFDHVGFRASGQPFTNDTIDFSDSTVKVAESKESNFWVWWVGGGAEGGVEF